MTQRRALGLLLIANVLWGTSYPVAKVALEEMPPPLVAAIRFTLAGSVLWLICLLPRWRPTAKSAAGSLLPSREDTRRLIVLGLFGVSINALLGLWGVSLTTATDASLMIVGEVIFTALVAAWLAGERIGRRKGIGIGIGIAGVVVLVTGSVRELGQAAGLPRVLGDGLILTGLFFEALYTVRGAGLARRHPPLMVLTLSLTGSAIVWLPLLVWYGGTGGFARISPIGLGAALYLALINSVACYLIWFSVLRTAGAALGAVSLLAQPLVGALLGLAVLGDPFTAGLAAGGSLILACLILTALPEREGVSADLRSAPSRHSS